MFDTQLQIIGDNPDDPTKWDKNIRTDPQELNEAFFEKAKVAMIPHEEAKEFNKSLPFCPEKTCTIL
jgi:hypothetical protein